MAQHTPGPWTVDETDVRDEAQKVLVIAAGIRKQRLIKVHP